MCFIYFSNRILEVLISAFSILSLFLPSCVYMYVCVKVRVKVLQ